MSGFEISNDNGDTNLGPVGGKGGSAKAGGYNQGNQIAGQGNFHGGIGSHKDLRGGSANASTGYNQGNMDGAQSGDGGMGSIPGKALGRASATGSAGAGSAKEVNGYNQGTMIAAKKK